MLRHRRSTSRMDGPVTPRREERPMEGGAAREEEGSALRKLTFSPIVRLVGPSVELGQPEEGARVRF